MKWTTKPDFTLSYLTIRIKQINIASIAAEEFLVIEKTLTLDIFLGIIYITIPKLLATTLIIV